MASGIAKSKAQRKLMRQSHENQKPKLPASWAVVRGILSCKYLQPQQQQPDKHQLLGKEEQASTRDESRKKMKCSASLCSNTKVTTTTHKKRPLTSTTKASNGVVLSPTSSSLYASMPFKKLYGGCYECKMVVDPSYPSLRSTICPCPQCGHIFMTPQTLELHQTVTHAVSELGDEDTSKNIVEIIFQSSWLKKQTPICKIERILKVENTPKTISKFEEYRDSIKGKATKLGKKHPRCIADGNELLRFHCTTLGCSLGLNGSSNLCSSIPQCNVCSIIKNGFEPADVGKGILTTATSGKAHDMSTGISADGNEKRAMLVCRVIAGRVKKCEEGSSMEDYDSLAGVAAGSMYSNLDKLYVFNPMAILPCFVVIYGGF